MTTMLEGILGLNEQNFIFFQARARHMTERSPRPIKRSQLEHRDNIPKAARIRQASPLVHTIRPRPPGFDIPANIFESEKLPSSDPKSKSTHVGWNAGPTPPSVAAARIERPKLMGMNWETAKDDSSTGSTTKPFVKYMNAATIQYDLDLRVGEPLG
ncbi:hypothetical protein F5Y16DRAFT_392376 [Xylariaceae sp. FL0255]|nr:hypothetical protein F5Y16DRAFT_392376 [Xylariaceae sp. FL0255]